MGAGDPCPSSFPLLRRGGAGAAELGAFPTNCRGLSKREGKKNATNHWVWAPSSASRGAAVQENIPALCSGEGAWISTGLALICFYFCVSQKQSAMVYFSKRGLGAAAVSFLSFNFPPCAVDQFCRGRGTFPRAGELLRQGPSLGIGLGENLLKSSIKHWGRKQFKTKSQGVKCPSAAGAELAPADC